MNIKDMLKKLNDFYTEKERIELELFNLHLIYEQINEDIDMMETSIMYKSNKIRRQ